MPPQRNITIRKTAGDRLVAVLEGIHYKPFRKSFMPHDRFGNRKPLLEVPFLVQDAGEELGTNLKLMSPGLAESVLIDTDVWSYMRPAFPLVVDQVVGYENPDTPLRKQITHVEGDIVLVLPTGKYKGEKGIALTIPDMTPEDILVDGNEYLIDVPEDRLVPIPDFPSTDGWYALHPGTHMPQGKGHNVFFDGGRKLERIDGAYVGLPVRDYAADYGMATLEGFNFHISLRRSTIPCYSMGVEVL